MHYLYQYGTQRTHHQCKGRATPQLAYHAALARGLEGNDCVHSEINKRLRNMVTPDLRATVGLQRADSAPRRRQKQSISSQRHAGSLQMLLAPTVRAITRLQCAERASCVAGVDNLKQACFF